MGLGIIVILLGAYIFLSGNLHSQSLTTRTEEQLIIHKDNLKECCTYLDKEGNEKTCSILIEVMSSFNFRV